MSGAIQVGFQDIVKASQRIKGHLKSSPVLTCSTINKLVGREVYFKAENLQKTGSFKSRGALNAVLAFKERGLSSTCSGVSTNSSGNHGQALAWASQQNDIPCVVVVPNNTSSVKVDAIKGYGAEVVFCEPNPTARIETNERICKERNMAFIAPYDNYDIIAGQGTIGLEFMEQVPDLDAIIVPVSGGGMSSGIALAAKELKPKIKVFVVEAKGKDLERSLRAGERLWPNPPQFVDTIAEGIRQQQVGHLTWPILNELVEKDVFSVTDQEMIAAMKMVFLRMKLVIEVTAGSGVAAVLSERMKNMDPSLKKVGVILCGGNADLDKLPWLSL